MREFAEQSARSITKRAGTSFYYSFLFLPRQKRQAIETIYALCRVLDDIVDEDCTNTNPQKQLNQWRTEIDTCFSQKQPKSSLGRDLKEILEFIPIPHQYFEDLIVGMEMDLEKNRYSNFAELERYCYHVAGVIGLICIEIFGYKDPSARDYAINLGIALQIANILRDLKEDALRLRVYLPQDEMLRFGYSEKELFHSVYNEKFISLMQYQSVRAYSFFKKARTVLAPINKSNMIVAEIMGNIYFKLLRQIEAANYNVFTQKIKLGKTQKVLIALKTWLGLNYYSI